MDILSRKPRQPPKNRPSTVETPSDAPKPLFDLTLPEPSPSSKMPQKKSRKLLWGLLIAAAIVIITTIVGAIWAIVWYNSALQPKSNDAKTVAIQVESGATVGQVGDDLQQKGVIRSSLAFTIYTKLHNKSVVKAGTYMFAPNQSVEEIVSWLNDGRVGTRKVTILPGKTLVQIKQSLIDSGFTEADVTAALAKHYDNAILSDKPASASLEGYIFPETYFVTSDSTADQLLSRTFDEFEKRIDAEDLRAKLQARGFSVYQGVTLASIVTKEVSNPTDQKQVAQVFETRLTAGMVLGSDVTYHYAAVLLGVAPSADIDSPYNTHKYPGLPPGPIANPSLTALEAVATPANGTYLYFVAGDDGKTYYATTYQEHVQNIQRYCQKLCAAP